MEHTCAGMYDTTCEACWEAMNLPGPEDTSGKCPDSYYEPQEWDVVGGL